ncbi:MAG: hypothetical protein AB7W59_01825 [Acidimicrobiia bacterium]
MNPLHSCEVAMRDMFAARGIDVTVSDLPPLVRGDFTACAPFTCPHGSQLWPEPTGEQIATWAQRRVS